MNRKWRTRIPPGYPLPLGLRLALRRHGIRPTRYLLLVSVRRQRMVLLEQSQVCKRRRRGPWPRYERRRTYVVSTSAYGLSQQADSYGTPLGLHRVARKVGGGWPAGTVFRSRRPVGLVWKGCARPFIVHRILWLEGLEPGHNRGGDVDTFLRYIYIHGFGDESTLGRPASHGCIHVAGAELMPLYERLPEGTLVWIQRD